MERVSSFLRLLAIAAIAYLAATWLFPAWFGGGDPAAQVQPAPRDGRVVEPRAASGTCTVEGQRFRAVLGGANAAVQRFELTDKKYSKGGRPVDLATTRDWALRQQLGFELRNAAAGNREDWLVGADQLTWDVEQVDPSTCRFRYEQGGARLTKLVQATPEPYTLRAELTVENASSTRRAYAAVVHTDAWRTVGETTGGMFRVSPFVTHVECIDPKGTATRLGEHDFAKDDFAGEAFRQSPTNTGDWYAVHGAANVASVSNAYFTHAIMPVRAPVAPECQLRVEERYNGALGKAKDPQAGAFYRARLAYPLQELAPGESHTYEVRAFAGPKEREALAASAGDQFQLARVIDLGFFAIIAEVLVAFLLYVHGIIPDWGISIIVLTVVARTLMFPLSVPGIRNMIKMRELKPLVDELNEKYKDDPQAKGLAQMELWRKHGANPLKGCLPQLASMPVWFALYTTLQTAVELYNTPFLWFPDLSDADPYYILPFIIGATAWLQQHIMPVAGGDPAQQQMMKYMMPAMFTVFMLFLPAGLGIYMFTNSLLGIGQQQVVEWWVRTHPKKPAGGAGPTPDPKLVAGDAQATRTSAKSGASKGAASA